MRVRFIRYDERGRPIDLRPGEKFLTADKVAAAPFVVGVYEIDRLHPASAQVLEALDEALDAREALAVPRWAFRYVRALLEQLRRTTAAVLMLLALAATAHAAPGLRVRFTPPDPRLVSCRLMVAGIMFGPNLLPIAAPCADEPATSCATFPFTLAPGRYVFRLACASGELVQGPGVVVTRFP